MVATALTPDGATRVAAMPKEPEPGAAPTAASLPARLVRTLRNLPRMAVAFSGGLDSRFLCHAALLCGCDVLAVHARGPHIPRHESAEAETWAQGRRLPLLLVSYNPLQFPDVAQTTPQRCYACKKGLIALLRNELTAQNDDRVLCDGTNADDMQVYRPGLRALREGGVRSPLAEAGLAKADVRAAARASGLDRPEQRARPCLLTRFAYGLAPNAAALRQLDEAEAALAALPAPDGAPGVLGDFRLRLTPAPLLQAQHLPGFLKTPVRALLARCGFPSCALVEGENISGFYDAERGSHTG